MWVGAASGAFCAVRVWECEKTLNEVGQSRRLYSDINLK